jgi:hypothetical protein
MAEGRRSVGERRPTDTAQITPDVFSVCRVTRDEKKTRRNAAATRQTRPPRPGASQAGGHGGSRDARRHKKQRKKNSPKRRRDATKPNKSHRIRAAPSRTAPGPDSPLQSADAAAADRPGDQGVAMRGPGGAGLACLLQSAVRGPGPRNGHGASGTRSACGQQSAVAAPPRRTEQGAGQPGGRTTPLGSASRRRRSTRGTGKPSGDTANGSASTDERLEPSAFTYPVCE